MHSRIESESGSRAWGVKNALEGFLVAPHGAERKVAYQVSA